MNAKATCPPVGLGYIAGVLIKAGHEVSIMEINAHRYTCEQVVRMLRNYRPCPDIIGIGGIVSTYKYVKWLTKEIKEIYPHIPLVVGGSVGSSIPDLILKYSSADLVVDKEGELTMLEIAGEMEKGNRDLRKVAGVFYRNGDGQRIVHSGVRERIKDLDSLPFPAYHLLPMEIYINNICEDPFYKKTLEVSGENRHMMLITSRGCTDKCTFCFRQFPKIAMNSASYVSEHILHLHSRYGVNRFTFMDELFIISRRRAIKLIDALKKLNRSINLLYRIASARADTVDMELLKGLKDSGCVSIVYGLESGSDRMLSSMKKRTTAEQNYKAVSLTHQAGLHTIPQFVVGLPGESETTLKETLRFADSIDFWEGVGFHYANPYPGTEIYEDAKKRGLIDNEDAFVEGLAGTDKYPLQLGEISFAEMKHLLRNFTILHVIRKNIRGNGYFFGICKTIVYFSVKIISELIKKLLECCSRCVHLGNVGQQ
ncbi:MAG: radical SAM protein [Planctomycetota bacterium]